MTMQTVDARHKLNPKTIVEIPLAWKDTPLWAMYDIMEDLPVVEEEPEAPIEPDLPKGSPKR